MKSAAFIRIDKLNPGNIDEEMAKITKKINDTFFYKL
jgi:hypothetical protein